MDTLPDLRVTIAESMEALASAMPIGRTRAAQLAEVRAIERLRTGAETLRWCAQYEAPSYEEMKADRDSAVASLEELEENTRDLVANVRYVVSKWEHSDACPGDPCTCALVERRDSMLDAVA